MPKCVGFSMDEVSRVDTEPWTDPRSVKSKGYFNFSSGECW